MEKNGPRVYADARADSYERSEMHHMYSCSPRRVVPIYIRLFPRSAYIAVLYRAEDGAPIHMCCAEGCGRHLCIGQGRAQAFSLEEILELFWCCSALMIILTGCHPMSFISAMFGVKKNEDILIPGKTAYLGSVGETMSVSATLYGVRSPVELLGITWSSADAAIAQLVGSTGSSIQVIAKKVGTTTITPSHPKAQNSPPITIHVSAAKARRQDVKYLAARTNAMELQIDSTENLRVRLIGGNALYEQGITWGVDDSTRLQMIGTSGSTVIVKGLMAGTVTVTASHPQSVNSLSITINVRDAVRRLLLSSSTMRLKKGDSAKALTLLIRGGFDTDYDNLSWSSSNESVATVFGEHRTVNIQPGTVPGNATITAELTLTGQKVTALVEVLPDMYIRLPRNMRVEEGKSETFTFEFATGGNPITFFPSDKAVTVVQGSGADKNKITVYGAAMKEGNFSIRAVAPGNVQDSAGVEVWVKRSLVITHANRAKITIEPGADAVVRNLAIVPQWEATGALKGDLGKGRVEAYMASGNNRLAQVRTNPQARTFEVKTTKEGIDAVMIRDTRTDPPTEYRIPIESEHRDLSKIIRLTPRQHNPMWVVHNADNGSGSNGHLDAHTTRGRVTLDIPASVNVQSFRFTGETASGSSAALKIQLPAYNNDERTVDFYMEARKFFRYPLDSHIMKRVQIFRYKHFVIMHGTRGDKEYKGSIAFESKGWQ